MSQAVVKIFWFLKILQETLAIRFRSSKYCLPLKFFGVRKFIFLSMFNSVTWEVKYHFSSKANPSNLFYNVFYPENDISCLTFRTQYRKDKGSFDLICGYSECRIAQFIALPSGAFQFQPYADNHNCLAPWQEFHILSGDPRHLLLYSCYMQQEEKVEGAYLLTRVGTNLSQAFFKRVMKPILLVANLRELITSDMESLSYCNCTDQCQYYELMLNCEQKSSEDATPFDVNYYLVGVIVLLTAAILAALAWIVQQKFEENFEDKES